MKAWILPMVLFALGVNAFPKPKQNTPPQCIDPTFACQDLQSATLCGVVSDCIHDIWSHMGAPDDNDEICDICKEMVKEARDQLLSNMTQEEIKEVFEGSCKLLHDKLVADACIKVVDEMIPQLVEMLASRMDPNMVCTVSGLCNAVPSSETLVSKFLKMILFHRNDDDCAECTTMMTNFKTFLKSTPESEVKKYIENFYDEKIPSYLRTSLVDDSHEMLFDYIKQLDTKGMCTFIGLCNNECSQTPLIELIPAIEDHKRVPMIKLEPADAISKNRYHTLKVEKQRNHGHLSNIPRMCLSKQNKRLRAIIMFIITKWVEPEVGQNTNGNIVVGAGYSSDSQQVVPQVCYNATVSSTSAQQGYVHLESALSYSELENTLGISVSISGKFGMFSAEAKANYMRSVQDKDYSISLNYYQYATNNIAIQLLGFGEDALTESGKKLYNGGKSPYFGLLCGDHYITDYQQGALLTMALNIKFSSSNEKKEFEEKAGATFGDIVSASESIKSVVTKYKITGSILIQAFQMGGEPSQLAYILNKDSSGQYYALSCSLTAMDNCIKAASGLLDYAKYNFSTQFSFQNNTGLTPLGIAFSHYNPIEYIGLTPPVSLVTQEVVQYRDELASRLKENEYYQQKFYPFFNRGYPVELHVNFINNANLILSKANRNVQILMQPHGGAADCFSFPDRCKNIKAGIDSQLQNITISDLKFLESMKYTVTTLGGMFYSTGSGIAYGATSWLAVPDNNPSRINVLAKVNDVIITDRTYSFDTEVYVPDLFQFVYAGHFNDSQMTYVGAWCDRRAGTGDWTWCMSNVLEYKLLSPFFFEAYNNIV